MRVFELAQQLSMSSKDLISLLGEMDIEVASPIAELDPGTDKLVHKRLGGQRATTSRVAAAADSGAAEGDEGGGRTKIKRKVSKKTAAKAPRRTVDMAPPQSAAAISQRIRAAKQAAAARAEQETAAATAPAPPEAPPVAPPQPTAEPPAPVREAPIPPTAPTPPVQKERPAKKKAAPSATPQPEPPPPAPVEPPKEAAPVVDPAIVARVQETEGKKKKKKTALRDKVKQKLKESKSQSTAAPVLPPVSEEVSERQQRRRERGPKEQVIHVPEVVTVDELAKLMAVKAADLMRTLMAQGVMATKNQPLDTDTVALVAEEFGFTVKAAASDLDIEEEAEIEDKPEDLKPRAPVVTVMGHVDHGKTSLLDYIRKATVAEGEAGGITQHIGAYRVSTKTGDVVFLDTPGHEAFTAMRAHGAKVTDVVVLVVAANDGVMPQTVEAINHAQAAEVPIVVAMNKIDLADADPDKVKRELAEHNVLVEGWGGNVQAVPVSAKTGQGVDDLLERLALESELLELKANPSREARGVVIEARLDRGRGPVATILVQHGTLHVGDIFVAGGEYGKVRGMLNEHGQKLTEAGPATPIEVLGFNGVPEAGDSFIAMDDERRARQISQHRQHKARLKAVAGQTTARVTLDDLHQFIEEGAIEELRVIIKADVHGSALALQESLEKISTDEVKLRCIHSAVGGITESDINLASASNALIIGFNVRPEPKARQLAEAAGVDMRLYRVIYDAIDDVRNAMSGLLKPTIRETITGRAEVRETFRISGVGTIAGCMVLSGEIGARDQVRVIRDNVVIKEGKLSSLKRFKDDVKSVQAGLECGIGVDHYNDIKVNDVLETFTVVEEERTL